MESALWYAIGIGGCFIGWYGELRFNAYLGRKYDCRPANIQWCPTPRAILGFLIFSLAGPLAVLVGLLTYAASASVMSDGEDTESRVMKWFTKPICK